MKLKLSRTNWSGALALLALALLAGCAGSEPNGGGAKTESANPDTSVHAVFGCYLKIQTALSDDSTERVAENARTLATSARKVPAEELPAEVSTKADALAKAKEIGVARAEFKDLSELLIQYLVDHKTQSGPYVEVYCPMQDASWLQSGDEVHNPYFGESMPGCGIVKRTF